MSSFKTSYLDSPTFVVPDVSIEQNYREIWAFIMACKTASGWVQTSDTGQYKPYATAYMRSNSVNTTQSFNPNAAMDGTTTNNTGAKSNNLVPTVGSPYKLYLDVGTNLGSFQALSSRILTYTNVWDPKNYTIDGSNDSGYNPANPDAASWTSIKVTSTHADIPDLSASNTSYQNLDTSTAYRYYRFTFTNTQNVSATYIQIAEIELYSAASGGGTKLAALTNSGPGTSTSTRTSNYQIWKSNDYGSAHGFPLYHKIYVGSGTWTGAPGISHGFSTATDGAGNFPSSAQAFAVRDMPAINTNSLNSAKRTIWCGNNVDTNATVSDCREHVALFYDLASCGLWWNIERSHNDDGTDDYDSDTARWDISLGYYSGYTYGLHLPKTGPVPSPQTRSGMLMNGDGTSSSIRGNKIALVMNKPFLGVEQLESIGIGCLWNNEGGKDAESIVTGSVYGSPHSYITLGSNYSAVDSHANFSTRLALRYE